jgi:hypothetical protein
MTGYLKRLMGLMLVLSVSTWAQAVCPMMSLPQAADHCAKAATIQSSDKRPEHDCCPGKRARMQHEQCHRTELSNSASATSCCAVEREPASTPKVLQAGADIAVIGRVTPSALQTPSRAVTWEISDAGPPLRGIMSLKEDLRI